MIEKGKQNGLITYDPYRKIANVDAFVKSVGSDIAKSRLFGCETVDQGNVLALECYATRTPPLSLAKRFDLIGGRLSMKADAMLADYVADGGEYDIVEYSPNACEIVFRYMNHNLPLRITWEMAQQEKWPFGKPGKDGSPTLKSGWSTPIGRQDMLWARVVSRGVRRVASHIVAGRYTPDELSDFVDAPQDVRESSGEGEAIDADFVVVHDHGVPEAVATSLEEQIIRDEPADGDSTSTQTERIRELCELLSIPLYKQQDMQAKRGVSAWRSLSSEQAVALIEQLETLLDKSQVPAEATAVETDGPIDQALIDKIKETISAIVQTTGVRYDEELKRHLVAAGLQRLADLTVSQGQELLKALDAKQLTAWAETALKPVAAG